jgi:uncharacterized membrane protein YphA (DoxX/SURF4 family)
MFFIYNFTLLKNSKMKLTATNREKLKSTINYLFILLFVYAAVSKTLDFQNFQAQLGLSPLLSAFADYVSFGVILVEVLIAVLIAIPRFRLIGLYSAFSLMVMFSTYIFIILNYSSFIPCSCGGILEKMTWKQHLIFNLIFVLLAATSIALTKTKAPTKNILIRLGGCALLSVAVVAVLFLMSEEMIQHKNSFIRRFPHAAATKTGEIDLKYSGYYFAGATSDKIYLANYTAPLQISVIDSNLRHKKTITLRISDDNFPFRSVQIKVLPPYFYVLDGTVPIIFKGSISDWKAYPLQKGYSYFSKAEPINSNTILFRAQQQKTGENILGVFKLGDTVMTSYAPTLLEKQIDGFFDTDGTLQYSNQLKKMVYVYRYRNQFIVTNDALQLNYRGNTIDTTKKAHLKIVYNSKSGDRKLGGTPYIVNASTALDGNLLFVNSALRGKYESETMWKEAAVVDVYDISQNSYRGSFYIYNIENEKMKTFMVTGNNLYVIIGHHLHKYHLGKAISNDNTTIRTKEADR